jgi:hypothetical protein
VGLLVASGGLFTASPAQHREAAREKAAKWRPNPEDAYRVRAAQVGERTEFIADENWKYTFATYVGRTWGENHAAAAIAEKSRYSEISLASHQDATQPLQLISA